jgi:hypothetical protein
MIHARFSARAALQVSDFPQARRRRLMSIHDVLRVETSLKEEFK